ncbi:hypothetical protein DdX_12396 [Ditylenchus destructor]|uniref:Uncharacterized protein n=1 Tax=Ditylenchus destructor TaxID=166010 RepID=A0AAD4R3R7_9BILA|nr:hypothetical protein DdX_12396 [Ditylenchus destructor]
MVAAVLEQQSDKREDERRSTEGPNAKTRDEDRPENGESRQPSELDDIREQPNRQGDSEPTHPQPAVNSATSIRSENHSSPNNCQTAPSAKLGDPIPPDSGEHIPIVRLRQKPNRGAVKTKAGMQLRENDDQQIVNGDENHAQNGVHREEAPANGELSGSMSVENGNGITTSSAAALLHRTMEALYEGTPEFEENTEEIRRLDSQLDHLNEYMDRVEERLKAHNEKLMETLRQQKEDREKRRRSFHEVIRPVTLYTEVIQQVYYYNESNKITEDQYGTNAHEKHNNTAEHE